MKGSNPRISVIVPVYNVEKYLPRCLNSIIHQTLEDIEVIVVNDGSKDNSLEIIKEFVEKDDRVKLIDKPNSGYGNSMNRGLDAATGEYIGIVESDDFIAADMFESLYALTNGGKVDVVKGNFYDYFEQDDKPPVITPNHERDMIADTEKPFKLKDDPQISWGHPSVWSAIYRREFLHENKIVFIEEKGGGWVDNPFFYETLCKAKSIMWTKRAFYFYYRSNPESSSNNQMDPKLPFIRMMDNLDVIEQNGFNDRPTKRCAYARALMYLNGAVQDFDYDASEKTITSYASDLMRRLDHECINEDFNLRDRLMYYTYSSPIKKISADLPKILIYNWVPFDNPWNRGGGVTVYCKNVIEEMLNKYPTATVYFLSSGFAYDASKTKTYIRKIDNIFGDRVHQYEIVNSPVPAEQRNIFVNPTVALKKEKLKEVFDEFINKYGPFKAVHFNNIEGLSLDVLDLKEKHPDTKFIFSIHNYVPMCLSGFYYMRHKHCNCSPDHTAEDCMKCSRMDMDANLAKEMYNRGTFAHDPKKCISKKRWIDAFDFEELDISVTEENILDFAKTATEKINKNCDNILAVSKRVYEIAEDNGFDTSKMEVSYIGTKVASIQRGSQSYEPKERLKIIFLGNDINNEEKGYPFLIDTLSEMPAKYAEKIDLVLTMKQEEHAEIYSMLRNFHSLKIVQGYTHADLPNLFKGCNLSLVPVLWEDNLPQIAIESVAYGVPVLASSAGGASELCDSELFKFAAGNAEELNAKIMHFVDKPEDLKEYWTHHHGLVTMGQHVDELAGYYGIDNSGTVEISKEDYGWLIKENDFLHKSISLNEADFISSSELEEIKNKLRKANEENERLREELEDMENMKQLNGKVTFQTDVAFDGAGAKLFKLTLEDFNYSDFYAEIKFIKLENLGASVADTLKISGTWFGEEGARKIVLHQFDWESADAPLKGMIYACPDKNSVIFFAKYPGRACGYDYSLTVLTSRSDRDSVEFERITQGFVWQNDMLPDNAVSGMRTVETPVANAAPAPTVEPGAEGKKSISDKLRGRR